MLRDHRKLRRAPKLVLSDRVQHLYPQLVAGTVEAMFRVDNPKPKPGLRRIVDGRAQAPRHPPARPRSATRIDRLEDVLVSADATGRAVSRSSELIGDDRASTSTSEPHIVVDTAICQDCSTRECIVACPANLFVPTADGGILFNYEQCFECGTCYLVCNKEGAISWSYPDGRLRRRVPPVVIVVRWK